MDEINDDRAAREWDVRVLAAHNNPHFMQSSTWEAVRRTGDWRVSRRELRLPDRDYPVLAFERRADGYGLLTHVPRASGLTADDVPALTERIRAARGNAMATKLELHQPKDDTLVAAFTAAGWLPCRTSQYRYTVLVDTSAGDDAMFAGMKKRARNEIRAAEREGVVTEHADLTHENMQRLIELVRETGQRSGAFFRHTDYLETVWRTFGDDDRGRLYLAWHDRDLLAGAFVVRFGSNAWYKDGGSSRDKPKHMASRYLQWQIMRDLAAAGAETYVLGHVPPPSEPDAPGRGILTFKNAFARDVHEFMPSFQLSHEPAGEEFRRVESAFVADYLRRTGDYWY